jgi:hypothetical protein
MARAYSVSPTQSSDLDHHQFSQDAESCTHAALQLFTIKRDDKPIGFFFCYHKHPTKRVALIVELMEWCEGVSARDKLEGALAFANVMKGKIPLYGYARKRDLRFFEAIAKRKGLRRIGNSFTVFPGEIGSVWESVV